MGFYREFKINENQTSEYLQSVVEKIRTTEDPDLLNDLTKLFKKNVTLTMRKYVVAYMLKESLKHFHPYNNHRNERLDRNRNSNDDYSKKYEKNDRYGKQDFIKTERIENVKSLSQEELTDATEEHPHHPRVIIAPEDATSIFVSIGKNRRVYPRDLVGILIAIAGIDRDRIGDIKVLANYSFVQLYTDDAQIAIDKLNGYDYRGRKLAVSYSRQRPLDEEDEDCEINETEE